LARLTHLIAKPTINALLKFMVSNRLAPNAISDSDGKD
jgi:hypothetical protein